METPDPATAIDDVSVTDGRSARRERSRVAVVDAAFALILDGKVPPTPADIADRAGVSMSSVFRNFDGLDDIQHRAIERFQERFGHLLADRADPEAPLTERIDRFVRRRVELYGVAGPVMRLARQRAVDHAPIAESLSTQRTRLLDQAHASFGPELTRSTPAAAANLLALLDAMTSPEAFDVMSGAHARTSRQITRTWIDGARALVDAHSQGAPA